MFLYCVVPLFFSSCIFTADSQSSTLDYTGHTPVTQNDPNQNTFSFTEEPKTTDTTANGLKTTDTIGTVTPISVSVATTESDITFSTTASELPTDATIETVTVPNDCVCDITPEFCDIGCCCDIVDCGIVDLSSVFSGCGPEAKSEVCIESWLMFRANVDPDLITVTDSLFCVQTVDENTTDPLTLPSISAQQTPLHSPHFSVQEPDSFIHHSLDFYRVDDIILTYYNSTSILSMLRQPSPGVASSSCLDRNYAKFLRTESVSCSRTVSVQSCLSDARLNAHSYFTDLSLLRIPSPPKLDMTDLLIPVKPLSDWPKPSLLNGSCLNVVSEVVYVIEFTGQGEITTVILNVVQTNTSIDTQLLQKHSVRFQLATPSPTPAPSPLAELKVGTPLSGLFDEEAQTMTVLAVPPGGECLADYLIRAPILFPNNVMTGCTFSSVSQNCSSLRSELYRILRGAATPDMVAMTSRSELDWSRVITEDCPSLPADDLCEAGCLLPLSLSVRILWAQRGLLAFPQNYILGAKYVFSCQRVKCPLMSPVAVTTEVVFSDATVYPEAPRGEPQPDWKFPFSFFTRGAGEQDGHE